MSIISNISVSLPNKFLTNESISEDRPNWNVKKATIRTGVEKRGISGDGETAFDLAVKAAINIFSNSLSPEDIDGIIFCTQTADYIMPGNASLIHSKFNFRENMMAFDINLACSGFSYSLGIASSLLANSKMNNILLFCGDTYSKLISPGDRSTKLLFGDGVSCTHVTKNQSGFNVIDTNYYTNGKHHERFIVKNGGSRSPIRKHFEYKNDKKQVVSRDPDFIDMDGIGIISFFNSRVPKAINAIIENNNLNINQIRFVIPHQASKLATDGIMKQLNLDESRFYFDITNTGNITSASIPLAISQLLNNDKIKNGDYIVCCGFGVGLSWSTTLLRYEL